VRKYSFLTEKDAKSKGFSSNYQFCTDKNMCPDGKDIMKVTKFNKSVEFEVSTDNLNNTIDVMVINESEYKKYNYGE
jgi:hypothetical protein